MKDELREKMTGAVSEFRLPRYKEITNVGLYLEQTVKFINAYLAPLGQPEITGSMVSNYVKKKLVANPQRKQYNADHIASLLFIAVMKAAVSLEDIRMMLEIQRLHFGVPTAYDYFCGEFETLLARAFRGGQAAGDGEEPLSDAQDLLRNMVVAVVQKIFLDRYLAAFRETETGE